MDVNTWGVSVLGQPLVDKWFGFGKAYKIWGVGYSDKDNNGEYGHYEDGIMIAC